MTDSVVVNQDEAGKQEWVPVVDDAVEVLATVEVRDREARGQWELVEGTRGSIIEVVLPGDVYMVSIYATHKYRIPKGSTSGLRERRLFDTRVRLSNMRYIGKRLPLMGMGDE